MPKDLTLSIVIPAYNEEGIIGKTLDTIISYLSKKNFSWEIIVADDGSSDKTPEIVNKYSGKKVRLVKLINNVGKGGALKAGVLSALANFVIFMDADLSVPLDNIDVFLPLLMDEETIVIASRRTKGAKILVHQPWHREMMGKVFTILTRTITGVPLTDFTCGFKGFKSKAAKKIFTNALIGRWAYDAEIMYLAKKYGYQIDEVPIEWKNRGDTRVRLRGVIAETFRDLLVIRVNDLLGKYGK